MPQDPQTPTLPGRLLEQLHGVRDGHLAIGNHDAAALAARFGSPLFVYDAALLRRALADLRGATLGRIDVYYSVKANPNPAIIQVFGQQGAGAEIASGAEYEAARRAGIDPGRILFAGPGKSTAELEHVIARGIGEIHAEAEDELDRLVDIARRLQRRIKVSLRVNPVDAAQGGSMRMGGKAAQFGIDEETLPAVIGRFAASPGLEIVGVHLFAGTQILDSGVLLRQWRHGIEVAGRVARELGRPLQTIDLGGGLGIPYHGKDQPLDLAHLQAGMPTLFALLDADPLLAKARVILEPGRYLAGPAGVYLARVVSVKASRGQWFAITDGGMHHHLAASGNLGQVIKRDYPLLLASRADAPVSDTPVTVVGPLCTPLDTWGRNTPLPLPVLGDTVAILQSGAYGLSASPVGFLSQPMPAEVLVDGDRIEQIGVRGTFENPRPQPLPFGA
ncbi:MAG: type III PLP-dependent enzyme [Burkholderiaceae bacterium]